jgi:predicted acylesterase/phospholipase RssA
MGQFTILSVSGGGIVGSVYARIIARLAANPSTNWLIQDTNLFAGTSVGGIIALALAAGKTPQQIDSLFSGASAMFTREVWRLADAGTLRAKWDNTGRTAVLTSVLGATTLGELPKLVAVNAFQDNGKPVWREQTLHNVPSRPGAAYPDFRSMSAVQAGLATSAAPTYFPSVGGWEDGGIAENDPSATAVIMTQDSGLTWPIPGGPIVLSDISLLSIGLEFPGDSTVGNETDTGTLDTICSLLNKLLTGNQYGAVQKCQALLGGNYFSLRPLLPAALNVAIDDYDAIPQLQQWADGIDLSNVIAWLQSKW